MGRFLRAWGAIAATLPLLLLWWGYKLAIIAASQAGFWRTLGLFEVITCLGLAAAGLVAALALRVPRPPAHAAAVALLGVTLLNTALTGFSIFYLTPRFAPKPLLAGVALVVAVVFVRFVRADAEEQRAGGRGLFAAGLAILAAILLPAPWVIAGALADQPHLPISPLPVPGLALRPDAPKRIIFVTFDALRARSTTLADPALDTTPNLATLGASSTVFTNMRSASDNTLVSLPTVLTGIRPSDYFPHIGNNSVYLREGFLTGVSGFLAPAGYRSYYATMLVNPLIFGLDGEFAAGQMTSGMFRRNQFNTRAYLPLAAAWNWTREKLAGHWDDEADIARNEVLATRDTFGEGVDYLKQAPGRSFLWLHLAVPHTPYYDVPPDRVNDPGDPTRYTRVTEGQVAAADHATLQHYQHIYEDWVRYGDAQLGRFLRELKAAGLYDDSLILVTADHGEEFGLPGHIPHGNGIATEDVTHVPLVIHLPGQTAGRRVDALVGHRDVVPTVLARVYQHPPGGLVGLPLLEGPVPADRYIFTWAMSSKYIPQLRQAQTVAAYHGPYKYLVRYPTGEESLYDLRQDPEAVTNLAGRLPAVVAEMRQRVRAELHP